jgi:hypothetical protein
MGWGVTVYNVKGKDLLYTGKDQAGERNGRRNIKIDIEKRSWGSNFVWGVVLKRLGGSSRKRGEILKAKDRGVWPVPKKRMQNCWCV